MLTPRNEGHQFNLVIVSELGVKKTFLAVDKGNHPKLAWNLKMSHQFARGANR